jgi:hypothetical protein
MQHTRTLPSPVATPPPINLRFASKQEVFDHVAHHLLTQGIPAKHYGFCKYKTEDGLTCAVGCCISPEQYDPRMEGQSIAVLAARFPHLGIPPNLVMLLTDLQEAHDDWATAPGQPDAETLRAKLCAMARRHFLSQEVALSSHPYHQRSEAIA